MKRLERQGLRRRRFATATGVVAVAALGLQAGAAAARHRSRRRPPVPRARVRTLTAPLASQPAAPRSAWQPPPPAHLVQRRGRQSLTATVAAIVFLLSGVTVIGVAVASQRRAPTQPPMTVPAVESGQAFTAPPGPASPPPEFSGRAGLPAAQPATGRGAQNFTAPDPLAAAAPPLTRPLARAKPVSIDIPAIGVRSVVRHTGQEANGSLQVPSGAQYDDAAWYRHSPTPGSLGPAILLGHIDSAARGPSVFFRLGELRQGDRVTITRADSSVAVFVVDAVHRYAKDSFPTNVVYGDIDHAGLRILTCGGAFDDAAGSYLDNIVVFASLADHKL